MQETQVNTVLIINIRPNKVITLLLLTTMLSICELHLQLPFDDCPTVAAADVDSV